jgi:VanZ family protein
VTRLYILVLALIVYGSLYPFRFEGAAGEPAAELLQSLQRGMYLRDALVNVAFYLPVGACGYLTMRKWRGRFVSFTFAVAAGVLLSLGIEVVQSAYLPTRLASFYDIGTNSLGSFLGAAIAAIYSRVQRKLDDDPAALALLVAWLAYLWFPLLAFIVPLRLADIEWTMIGLVSTAAAWYVIGHAIEAAGFRPGFLLACWRFRLASPSCRGMSCWLTSRAPRPERRHFSVFEFDVGRRCCCCSLSVDCFRFGLPSSRHCRGYHSPACSKRTGNVAR